MWSSEEDTPYPRRAGRTYEADLQLRYLAPGAFTILPPEAQDAPPDSPPVLNTYRLTPTARRHRNAAFSIIADQTSNPGSRSPSPTGRVSPFRGRGFNPIGSRHASPIPSPPPQEDIRLPSTKRSKIPTLSRRGSTAELKEEQPPRRKPKPNLSKQFSKSLTNVSPRQVSHKPPPSPGRHGKYAKNPPTFPKLSPIVGSSPERTPDSGRLKVRSSPSKIPRSRSQPPGNRSSENNSKNNSKNPSRDASPSKLNTKDKYKNVKAKVNSFNSKPKVPPKPQVPMPKLERKDSNNKTKNAKSTDNNSSSNRSSSSDKNKKVKSGSSDENKIEVDEIENDALIEEAKPKPVELRRNESNLKIIDASTVVSSTTTTASKPLNIETNFELDGKEGDNSMYLPDVRTLSATSVSSAINRMNDTVLDTKTLMKGVAPTVTTTNASDPEVLSIISDKSGVTATENLFGSEVKPNGDRSSPTLNTLRDGNDHLGVGSVTSVTNGRTKVLSPHDSVVGISVLPKSANDRIKEARTLVATDVQPIQITVKEKPLNADVQSGNVRLSPSATNGISERPGLPPPQTPQEDAATTSEPPKGCCGRLMGRCKKQSDGKAKGAEKKKRWCFSKETVPDKTNASSANTTESDKVKWWHKLQCCKRKKIGDVESADVSQRKDSWGGRTNSHTSETPKTSARDKCKNFLRTIFCLNLCAKRRKKKEQEEAMRRRASIMSKKKSLTPAATTVEEPTTKLDAGLVEHTSVMKAAIPVLPVSLAWFCLILNVFLPGIGTIFSGLFCLCMGKPRFSQKDGPKPRIGACIIDFFIGCGQLFTVLFCLVGWGWSIWWGIIMLKVAKKYRKIRRAERSMEEDARNAPSMNHTDIERGS